MASIRMNLLFGGVVALLAITALISAYLNLGSPVVQPAIQDTPAAAADTKLPEGHPPLDVANKLQALEQVSRDNPQNADYKFQIGNAYYDLGQYQKALDAYKQGLALQPQNPSVETDMSTCYHFLGQPDAALEVLDHVLKYSPNFPQALFNKGVVLIEDKKDVKGGISAWEDLLRTNPNFPQRGEIEQRIRQLQAKGGL
jgi:cytochrome c-type biogenesis protein CcmH/NrfG